MRDTVFYVGKQVKINKPQSDFHGKVGVIIDIYDSGFVVETTDEGEHVDVSRSELKDPNA